MTKRRNSENRALLINGQKILVFNSNVMVAFYLDGHHGMPHVLSNELRYL